METLDPSSIASMSEKEAEYAMMSEMRVECAPWAWSYARIKGMPVAMES